MMSTAQERINWKKPMIIVDHFYFYFSVKEELLFTRFLEEGYV